MTQTQALPPPAQQALLDDHDALYEVLQAAMAQYPGLTAQGRNGLGVTLLNETRRRGPLASPSGKTLTRYCQAVTEPGRRPLPADAAEAMQQADEAAIAALKRPASLRILTNRCPNLGAAAKAALGAGHEVSVFYARGDTMGQQGRDAYAAGKRYLAGWPSRAEHDCTPDE